jgi:hypothetical protein
MVIYPNKVDGETGSPEQSIQIYQSTSRYISKDSNRLVATITASHVIVHATAVKLVRLYR